MLELMLCSLATMLPNYLILRFVYKKKWGKEINFFNMWHEYRYGLTTCAILTTALISLISYYHPTTTNVTAIFRTVTILAEATGRVKEVYVGNHQMVKQGDPLFRLDSSRQEAAVESAKSAILEVKAEFALAEASLMEVEGAVDSAKSQLAQAMDNLKRKQEIAKGGRGLISESEIETSRNQAASATGALDSANARRAEAQAKITTSLPARQKSAEDKLEQAKVDLEKTVVYAGTSGVMAQMMLEPGDIVSSMIRVAAILIPEGRGSGAQAVQAGFNQLAAPVVKKGTVAELSCMTRPFKTIPMVVTDVQLQIAAGQIRPSDQIIDLQDRAKPGTLTVTMEPLYENGLEGINPGSKCVANAYTSNHELLASGTLGTMDTLYYHMVDTVGLAHALILRIQVLMAPVQVLVFAGH
jgi:multidrug resistance efflux pump